jgi:hypothetical protein
MGGVAFWRSGRYWKRTDGFGPLGYVLTSNGEDADPSMQAAAGTLSRATITLTNAQIKALPTTSQTVVAAGGADTVLIPVMAAIFLNTTAGAYTNVETGEAEHGWTITYGQWLVDAMGFTRMPTDATRRTALLGAYWDVPSVPMLTAQYPPYSGSMRANTVINAPLMVSAWNGVLGDYTGGHASNSAKVVVYYRTESFA